MQLVIDIETYSPEDLGDAGVYKYAEHPDFEILLIGYATNDEPVRLIDMTAPGAGEEYARLAEYLTDAQTVKIAHNCSFERACLSRTFGIALPPDEWEDTMHMAQRCGLPASLEAAGAALRLEIQKSADGKALINYFCKPCKPSQTNGGRTRNLPTHAPEKWARFCEYCKRDVETERALYRRLCKTDAPTEAERAIEILDAKINARGIPIDREFAAAAAEMDATFKTDKLRLMRMLTGLENPQSALQLKCWLQTQGVRTDKTDKKTLAALSGAAISPTVRRVLALREMLGKTSTAKYPAVLAATCADGRIRGTLQYYGAGRTGRWAGRILQPQNLPQNHLDYLDAYREIVRRGDLPGLSLLAPNVPDVLSQLIRTVIVAGEGQTLLVADYHAIEAVCLAYLADEKWRLKVFAGDGKIYEASYAQAFGVPKESVTKGSPERQKGKIMELACGYGGGVGALTAFGADKLGLSAAQMQALIDNWRAASPHIVRLWRRLENAAKQAIGSRGETVALTRADGYRIAAFRADADGLTLTLPSERILRYWHARVTDGRITFDAQNQTTRKWEPSETYGGKLCENLVQAFARDILAAAMLRLDEAGYEILFSVHDEIICEAPTGGRWEDMAAIMGAPVDFAPGLDRYLYADGYSTPFYRKD